MVGHQRPTRRRHERRQALEQLERVQEQRRGPVAPRAAQLVEQLAARALRQPLQRQLARYKGEKKGDIEKQLAEMSKVNYTERQRCLGVFSAAPHPLMRWPPVFEDNADWRRALALGLSDLDAHHVMVASREECDVLLTLDRGVLYRAAAIQREFGLRVMRPSKLCAEMGWS